jgi:hypothetical protein
MDSIPFEILKCVFNHLDAFDAHCFGFTHHRAFLVIKSERELAKISVEKSQYDRWFDDVLKTTRVMVKEYAVDYADDPDYSLWLRKDIEDCDDWVFEEKLSDYVIFGSEFPYSNLSYFARGVVEAHIEVVFSEKMDVCTSCGLLCFERAMSYGMCLECAFA